MPQSTRFSWPRCLIPLFPPCPHLPGEDPEWEGGREWGLRSPLRAHRAESFGIPHIPASFPETTIEMIPHSPALPSSEVSSLPAAVTPHQ